IIYKAVNLSKEAAKISLTIGKKENDIGKTLKTKTTEPTINENQQVYFKLLEKVILLNFLIIFDILEKV
ncbi:hypothetical protein LGW04_09025, partial [Streptococcus mutans]|nr:hypothetical protein [Streptococcus mutans]